MRFGKVFLLLFMATAILTACKKEPAYDIEKQLAVEDASIKAFIASNNIVAQKHEKSGIYYVLTSPGTGTFAYSNLNITAITVKYSGKLLNGQQFDGNALGVTFGPPQIPNGLGGLIDAWKIALAPKAIGGIVEGGLQKGGKIRILTPSPYAYGPNPNGAIPANSILDFEIELVDVKE
jgi:FKBP-type peptidyl-prolyl cis-trans isomerase FkpA